MIISPAQAEQLNALQVYAVRIDTQITSHKDNPWPTAPIEVRVSLHGYGESSLVATPTWSTGSVAVCPQDAFERALLYAPAVREECIARAAGRLGDILPEYDPDGSKARAKRSRPKSSGKKMGLEELNALLGL